MWLPGEGDGEGGTDSVIDRIDGTLQFIRLRPITRYVSSQPTRNSQPACSSSRQRDGASRVQRTACPCIDFNRALAG